MNKFSHILNDKLFYGGNLGLQFGTVTRIDISPMLGFKVTEKFTPGLGFIYQYMNDRNYPDSKLNVFGGRIFLRYYFFERFFTHAEYEYLTFKTNNFNPIGKEEQISLNNILLGGGIREKISEKTYVNLAILWNINESAYSLYSNPIIRGGVIFGL